MRKVLTGIAGAPAAMAILAAVPVAAAPAHHKHFSGSGSDYMNNAPSWKREASGRFSFTTSRDGGRVLGFRGTYSYYCGAGTNTVTAGYLTVSPSGKFDYRFSQRIKNGTDYVEIYGRFLRGGKRVQVNYLVDVVFKGNKVRHPYDTAHPRSLGCASWVRGLAKAG